MATEIFEGNINKTITLLDELFVVYIKELCTRMLSACSSGTTRHLNSTHVPLPLELFKEGDISSVWPHFQSGVAIFCCIYHYYGPVMVGSGVTTIRIDPMRVVSQPDNYDDTRANLTYIFALLKALEIETLWTTDEWLTYPDTEFAILQLSYIYEALRHRQCNLPPAHGTTAGVLTGADGEALVVGLTWSDTRAAGLDMHRHSKHCTALLGASENSIPMLPIDSGESDQKDPTKAMLSSMPPMGLLSSAVRFQQKRIDVDVPVTQKTTNRPGWNSRTREDNLRVTENPHDASFVAVLQKRNQSVENSVENINGERPRYAAASRSL